MVRTKYCYFKTLYLPLPVLPLRPLPTSTYSIYCFSNGAVIIIISRKKTPFPLFPLVLFFLSIKTNRKNNWKNISRQERYFLLLKLVQMFIFLSFLLILFLYSSMVSQFLSLGLKMTLAINVFTREIYTLFLILLFTFLNLYKFLIGYNSLKSLFLIQAK